MITGSCHCGAVTFEVDDTPQRLVSCNCSICRRLAPLWFHTATDNTKLNGETDSYAWGDKMLAFQRCRTCGCTTHYLPLDDTRRMAVNVRMSDPEQINDVPIRRFDGADSWAFLD